MYQKLNEEISALKKERNAVILAHLYQQPEVQDVADFTGDSLGLARQAAKTDADVIVFCGVHFMAESAAILSPQKTVLLPEENAGCPMADMITTDQLRAKKKEHPDAVVVCYVNSSAEVKAESDICCTSSNAVQVVDSISPDKEIIFVPDKNLGHYVSLKTKRKIIFWEGYCNTHNWLTLEDIQAKKQRNPEAVVLVHPECRPEVVAKADGVFSTSGMIDYVGQTTAQQFIIGTEMGILHQLTKKYPKKDFILASTKLVCPNMKATTLAKVKWSLESLSPCITVSEKIKQQAISSLEKMLAVRSV